jgi:hypothetical protein
VSFTLAYADMGEIIIDTSTEKEITIPSATNTKGLWYRFINMDAEASIMSEDDAITPVTVLGTGVSILLISDGTNWVDGSEIMTSLIFGTTNQVSVTDNSNGTVTLALPQDIDVLAEPQFAGIKLKDETNIGKMVWNNADKCIDVQLSTDVTVSLGQEMYIRCVNKTASTITNGSVVYISGAQGSRPKMDLADASTYALSYKTIGMVTEDVAVNDEGFVTTLGLVRDVDTSAWIDGTCLYLSETAGGVTATPNFGTSLVKVGMVVHSNANNGIICVNVHPDKYRFGNIDAGNYSYFEEDGTLVATGNATVWKDIDFPIIIRTTGANIPALTILQGNITVPQWQVNDLNVCEGQEFIHEWKEGSPVYWHVHMITNGLDATARYVKWEVEWVWCNVSGQVSSTNTQSYEHTIPANTPDKTMQIVSIYSWTPSGGKIGGHVYARLRRIASTGTAPTNDPWCSMLQLHIESDTMGSRTIANK